MPARRHPLPFLLLVAALLAVVSACSSAGASPTGATGGSAISAQECLARFTAPPGDGPALVIVADRTADSGAVQLSDAERSTAADATLHGGSIAILAVDGGAPRWVVRDRSLLPADLTNLDSPRAARIASSAADCITAVAQTATPTTAGSDILQAIQVAARSIGAAKRSTGTAQMVVSSNGLANRGALSFLTVPIAGVDPNAVVAALTTAGQIPDLSGIHVDVSGIGATPSGPANQVAAAWLVSVWTGICQAGHAMSCNVQASSAGAAATPDSTLPDDPQPALPAVTSISLDPTTCVFTLPASITFAPGSADLLPGAESAIPAIVDALRNPVGATAILLGHTASVGNDVPLSLARAEAVARLVVAGGISPGSLQSVGKGSTEPAVNDLDAHGQLVEALAEQNRRVDIVVSGTNRCPR